MYKCPNCGKRSIPIWRALVMPAIAPSFPCPQCRKKIERKSGLVDVFAFIPFVVASIVIYRGHDTTVSQAWHLYLIAGVGGIIMWLPLVRYQASPDRLRRHQP